MKNPIQTALILFILGVYSAPGKGLCQPSPSLRVAVGGVQDKTTLIYLNHPTDLFQAYKPGYGLQMSLSYLHPIGQSAWRLLFTLENVSFNYGVSAITPNPNGGIVGEQSHVRTGQNLMVSIGKLYTFTFWKSWKLQLGGQLGYLEKKNRRGIYLSDMDTTSYPKYQWDLWVPQQGDINRAVVLIPSIHLGKRFANQSALFFKVQMGFARGMLADGAGTVEVTYADQTRESFRFFVDNKGNHNAFSFGYQFPLVRKQSPPELHPYPLSP